MRAKTKLVLAFSILAYVAMSILAISGIFAYTQQSVSSACEVSYTVDASNFAFTDIDSSTCSASLTTSASITNGKLIVPSTYNGKTVTQISASGFANREDIVEAVLPSTLITINENAFEGCVNLKTVTIPSSVQTIGAYAFSECSSLENLTFEKAENSSLVISSYAFNECRALVEVTLPETATEIYSGAFNNCSGVIAVYIETTNEDSIIEAGAFGGEFGMDAGAAIYCTIAEQPSGWDLSETSEYVSEIVFGY